MNIVFYTSAISGAGRLVIAMSIGNAFIRKGIKCRYTIIHTSPVSHLADDFDNIKIPLETEEELSKKNYHKSILFKTLKKLKPDVLLVNHQWYMIYNFIHELVCKKIYLSDYVYDAHFRIPLPEEDLVFNPRQYERVLAIEPFTCPIPMGTINPLVLRNQDEILTRDKALRHIGQDGSKKIALYAFSGNPEDQECFMKKFSSIDKEYEFVRMSLYSGSLFPLVDYYNAFDFIVCSGGYNFVWDSVFFNKKAHFIPVNTKFSDQNVRIKNSRKYTFDINGADQLVDIILRM